MSRRETDNKSVAWKVAYALVLVAVASFLIVLVAVKVAKG